MPMLIQKRNPKRYKNKRKIKKQQTMSALRKKGGKNKGKDAHCNEHNNKKIGFQASHASFTLKKGNKSSDDPVSRT